MPRSSSQPVKMADTRPCLRDSTPVVFPTRPQPNQILKPRRRRSCFGSLLGSRVSSQPETEYQKRLFYLFLKQSSLPDVEYALLFPL